MQNGTQMNADKKASTPRYWLLVIRYLGCGYAAL